MCELCEAPCPSQQFCLFCLSGLLLLLEVAHPTTPTITRELDGRVPLTVFLPSSPLLLSQVSFQPLVGFQGSFSCGTLLFIIYLFILTALTESTLALLSYLDISSGFSSPGVFLLRLHTCRKLSLSWAALPWAPAWVSVGSTSQHLGAEMCLLRFPKIIAVSCHVS